MRAGVRVDVRGVAGGGLPDSGRCSPVRDCMAGGMAAPFGLIGRTEGVAVGEQGGRSGG